MRQHKFLPIPAADYSVIFLRFEPGEHSEDIMGYRSYGAPAYYLYKVGQGHSKPIQFAITMSGTCESILGNRGINGEKWFQDHAKDLIAKALQRRVCQQTHRHVVTSGDLQEWKMLPRDPHEPRSWFKRFK